MEVYKRVPGGEKTEKSGVSWSKSEIERVYELYLSIGGKGIHERNPHIHELAKEIDRSVRSIEAQLLMFRALERGGEYSHKNMNNLTKTVWDERSIKTNIIPNSNISMSNNEFVYPHDLLAWAGHQKGGVKAPFRRDSGRPVGEVIETKLVRKLKQWVEEITAKNDVPRILLLIGGPGNGKTDALEFFVECLDKSLNADNQLFGEFENRFANSTPRKAIADISKYKIEFDSLEIVPDASVGESSLSKEECLVNDLKSCIENKKTLYISCINRGILAKAAENAEKNKSIVPNFLNKISDYISQDESRFSLWPIEEHKEIAIWPMDIESLVEIDRSIPNNAVTPIHLILDKVLDDSKWSACNSCNSRSLCPFHINKLELSEPFVKEHFINILRRYEIMSGKRWSFRDVFSLIPYILVGTEDDFKSSSPCNWVKNHISDIENDLDSIKSAFDLSSHLYTHRLFSIWPKLTAISKGRKFKDIFEVLKANQGDQLFKVLAYRKKDENTFISNLIKTQFSQLLDPANLSGSNLKIESINSTILEIEDHFSNSVAFGYSEVEKGLNELEKVFVLRLIKIEEKLINLEISKNLATQLDFIVNIHKSFVCKFIKRSLGVKNGFTNDDEYITEYIRLLDVGDKSELKKYQKLFKRVLNPNDEFIVSLSNTFGQPKSEHSRNILLKVNSISVKLEHSDIKNESIPRVYIPYFEILKKRTPLSYGLYKSLMKIEKGVNQASLPSEVMAQIDSLVSKIGGVIVRDPNHLSNASITIGNMPLELTLDGTDIDLLEVKTLKK